jgi:hypothetical protein
MRLAQSLPDRARAPCGASTSNGRLAPTQSEFADGLMQGFGSLDAFQFGNFVLELQLAPLQLRQSALIRRWVMPFAFDVTVKGVVTAFKLSEVTFQRHALLLLGDASTKIV